MNTEIGLEAMTEQHQRDSEKRAVLMSTLPPKLQTVLASLPGAGRCYLLDRLFILNNPDASHRHQIERSMIEGALGYAFTLDQMKGEDYLRLSEFFKQQGSQST